MAGMRIFWGQVVLVIAVALGFVWAGTEWTAWRLAFQPALGEPWMTIYGLPIYPPHMLFVWWFQYEAYAPSIFEEGGAIAAAGGIVTIIVAIALSVLRAREARHVTTYGSAEWAASRDVHRAGLFGEDGVVLGRYRRHYLRHHGPEHVLCFAPTRSGKGVGLVIPTLLTWPGSAIVHDIKGENWTTTAGWRARFGRVLRFDPTDRATSAYNPLLEIRPGDQEVRDAQNVADLLVDPDGSIEKRNHWEKTAHALLVGAILHVLYAGHDKTLAGVAHFLADPGRRIDDGLKAMLATRHLTTGPHPVIASAARELLNKSDNERSGVLSTAMSFLSLYRDPVVAAATARCDWRINDLVEGTAPVTLYLVVPPSDLQRTRPLVRLILNQIGRRLTERLDAAPRRQRLLFMLDEFAALGRLEFFESQLAFMAAYGMRAFLIAQSLNQIEKAYGPNNAILDNCHVRVTFATNDERTARRISDALGTATELRAMKNYAGHRLSPWLGHLMVSRQETSRPLLTPGEVMQLPPDQSIVMVSGAKPIRATKARYYADPLFMKRILPPPSKSEPLSTADPWTERAPAPGGGIAGLLTWRGSTPKPADGGLRREPDLAAPDQAIPAPEPKVNEFDGQIDHPDLEDAHNRQLLRRAQAIARQAALDRDDGIEL